MVGAQSYVTHTHTHILSRGFSWAMFRIGEHCGRGTELCHTHTHILSHGFSWAMFRIGEHCGRGTELCHTHTYCLIALVGQCSG